MLTQIGHWLSGKLVTQCVGLSIFVGKDGKRCFQLLLLEKQKGGDLSIVQKAGFVQLDDVTSWLKAYTTLPVIGLLDGKSILVRFLPVTGADSGLDKVKVLKQVVPTGELDDFVVDTVSTASGIIAAVSRVDYVQGILQELNAAGISFIQLLLGLPGYYQFHEYFNAGQNGSVQYGQYLIDQNEIGITGIARQNPTSDQIASEEYQLTHEQVPAFALAASHFLPKDAATDFEELTLEQQQDFYHWQLNKILAMAVPGVLLVLLLINTMIFFSASSKNAVLKEASAGKQLMYRTYTEKKELYEEKKAVIDQLNSANSHFAYISAEVGGTVIPGIMLSDMAIYPFLEQGRTKKFERNKLVIKGESNDATIFGRFIDNVQKLHFVDDIGYQDYSFNSRKGKGVFHIEVVMNELE